MKTIDIEDLPGPIAQALIEFVKKIQEQLHTKEIKPNPRVNLPVWQGKVLSRLRREDIYEQIG